MTTRPQTALILGASGKIGRHFTAAFQAAGWQTRAYTRGTDMAQAARGVDVIVNGLNPPNYHDWKTILPAITDQVIDAAKASGATILFPGNVYVYGDQPGPWDENTPHRANSRKGQLRIEAEASYRAAATQGVQTIILRAGDFLTPEMGESALDLIYLREIKKGRLTSAGDPNAVRAHAWMPDLARAGAMLAQKRHELPSFADIPFAGHSFSSNQLAATIREITGKPLKISRFPWWIMTVASPFWELARELKEMRYLFSHPHQLRGDALRNVLPDYEDTEFKDVIREALKTRL